MMPDLEELKRQGIKLWKLNDTFDSKGNNKRCYSTMPIILFSNRQYG